MTTMGDDSRYAFLVEWYDPYAALLRHYHLLCYPIDDTIEMVDLKSKKTFLRRSPTEEVTLNDLYIGSTINILSRQLRVVDFADNYTQRNLVSKTEKTLAIIKPAAVAQVGEILTSIQDAGFAITKLKMVRLGRNQAEEFYWEHRDKHFVTHLLNTMISGPVVAIELMRTHATTEFRKLIGPTDPKEARAENPQSLRARFGVDAYNNAMHGSDDFEAAVKELDFFFPANKPALKPVARFDKSTLAIIKPHAVKAGLTGQLIKAIQEGGFEVAGLAMFQIERANGEEFYAAYQGVLPEHVPMVTELCSGSCVAVEVSGKGDADVVQGNFRELCGPWDPEIARHLRPHTIRARYGKDKVRNAIHCTDLPEDGQLEVQYFFQILDS